MMMMTGPTKSSRAVGKAEAPSLTRRWPFAALLLAAALVVSGCNTLQGFGEDVEEVGEEVDEEL